jgi:hypothetical protein
MGTVRKEAAVLGCGVGVTGVLLGVNAVVRYIDYRLDVAHPGHTTIDPVTIFDINGEANVPTWWNSGLLLAAALAAVAVALLQRRRGFYVLAAVLGGMSLDEVAGFHERLKAMGDAVAGNAVHFTWVVPGAVIALLALVVLARSIRDAPRSVQRGLGIAAALYLFGAVAMETVGGAVLERAGDGRVYLLVSSVEEGSEMVAASLFVYTLLVALDIGRVTRGYDLAGPLEAAPFGGAPRKGDERRKEPALVG